MARLLPISIASLVLTVQRIPVQVHRNPSLRIGFVSASCSFTCWQSAIYTSLRQHSSSLWDHFLEVESLGPRGENGCLQNVLSSVLEGSPRERVSGPRWRPGMARGRAGRRDGWAGTRAPGPDMAHPAMGQVPGEHVPWSRLSPTVLQPVACKIECMIRCI